MAQRQRGASSSARGVRGLTGVKPDTPRCRRTRPAKESVWITSITLFETRLGLALLPAGRRRQALEAAFERLLVDDLDRRVLAFDTPAATAAATLAAARQQAGRPVDVRDTQIAGIALARRGALATCNVRHFADLDVPVVDPWVA
jgi:predicted nucleic acid-binding protein